MYLEELTVDYHPIHKWFLSNNQSWFYFSYEVSRKLVIDTKEFIKVMETEYNAKTFGINMYFNTYNEADAAREWILSMDTMRQLRSS